MISVMIVDDEALIRKGLSTLIDWESMGCRLTAEAENGEQAKELFAQYQPRIVLSDIKMPLCDGLELSRWIYEEHPETQVILLTAFVDFEYARQAMRYGVTDYIPKTGNMDEIAAAVERCKIRLEKNAASAVAETSQTSFTEEEKPKDLIGMALAYIDEHYQEALTPKAVSDALHVSPGYLSRSFKARTGRTLVDTITARKIEHAQKLLEGGGVKIFEAARAVGFDDPAYFSHVFKKLTGLSPKSFKL